MVTGVATDAEGTSGVSSVEESTLSLIEAKDGTDVED